MDNIGNSHENIVSSWSALRTQWSDTRRQWRDAVGERFAREFWEEWEEIVPQALRAIEELGEVMEQALQSEQDPQRG